MVLQIRRPLFYDLIDLLGKIKKNVEGDPADCGVFTPADRDFGQAGIKERYILPSAIGFSMFFIILVQKKKILSGKRKMIYQLGIILLLMAHGRVALREADYFRYRGESITTMLETVREMSQGEENILSCFRPNEEGNLVIHFWMAVHGLDNVYFWTEEDRIGQIGAGTVNPPMECFKKAVLAYAEKLGFSYGEDRK